MKDEKIKRELDKRIWRQHKMGCKLAIGITVVLTVMDSIMIDEYDWIFFVLSMGAAALTLAGLVLKKRWNISSEGIALIPMLSTLTVLAYTCNTVELEVYQLLSYGYAVLFIGGGMFILWRIKYSIITVAYSIFISAFFYALYSPIKFTDYILYGGVLIVSVAVFMVLSIEVRYRLTVKTIQFEHDLQASKRKLKASEEQHRLLFEQNPTPMIICSIESMEIVAVNNQVIEKYQFQRNELLGMKLQDLHREIDVEDVILCSSDADYSDEKINEWIHVLKDKTEINVELRSNTINYEMKEARLISVNDVTKVKTYQSELIDTRQQAIKAKELQGQFLSNMSHEIRTPMNGIIGLTRILKETTLNNDQQKYVNAIVKSSENLMVIINDILDFSKIEAGKIALEKAPFDLDELLAVNQDILSVKALEKQIYLRLEKDPSVPRWLMGDPVRLNQILINLITNAIKFTEVGGVTVRVSSTVIESGMKLKVEVIDTGIGIDSSKLGAVFQSFVQANSSTTRTHGGTGLGLSISKQLVELQGGKLWVESELGEGANFSFEIDYELGAQTLEQKRKEEEDLHKSKLEILSELQGIDVLLVEDHPINQMLARTVLESWGFSVDLAENGSEAVDMVQKRDYDVVLMDISMPIMDGYTATKEIRSGRHQCDTEIPIIAMTASALLGENKKCFEVGMNGYLSKPFDPDKLLQIIGQQVGMKRRRA